MNPQRDKMDKKTTILCLIKLEKFIVLFVCTIKLVTELIVNFVQSIY